MPCVPWSDLPAVGFRESKPRDSMTRRLLLRMRGGRGGIVVRRANRAKCVLPALEAPIVEASPDVAIVVAEVVNLARNPQVIRRA